MNAAFLMDLSCYFIGPVRLVYENPDTEFALLPYAGPAGALFARFMRFYNSRLAKIAERRWQAGAYGRCNSGHRFLIKAGFVPAFYPMLKSLWRGARIWIKAECQCLLLPRGQSIPPGRKSRSILPPSAAPDTQPA